MYYTFSIRGQSDTMFNAATLAPVWNTGGGFPPFFGGKSGYEIHKRWVLKGKNTMRTWDFRGWSGWWYIPMITPICLPMSHEYVGCLLTTVKMIDVWWLTQVVISGTGCWKSTRESVDRVKVLVVTIFRLEPSKLRVFVWLGEWFWLHQPIGQATPFQSLEAHKSSPSEAGTTLKRGWHMMSWCHWLNFI